MSDIGKYLNLGSQIRLCRQSKGYTQKEAAALIGIPRTTYSNYENEHRTPNVATLTKIANVLDADLRVLLGTCDDRVETKDDRTVNFDIREEMDRVVKLIQQAAEESSPNIDLFRAYGRCVNSSAAKVRAVIRYVTTDGHPFDDKMDAIKYQFLLDAKEEKHKRK